MFVFIAFFPTPPYNNLFSSPHVWWFVSPPYWALSHNSTAIMVSEFHPAPLPSHYVLHAEFCFYVLFCFSAMMDLSALLTNARSCSFDESAALVCVLYVVGDPMATPQHVFFSIAVQLDLQVLLPVLCCFSFFCYFKLFFYCPPQYFFPPQCYTAVYVGLLTALFLTFK